MSDRREQEILDALEASFKSGVLPPPECLELESSLGNDDPTEPIPQLVIPKGEAPPLTEAEMARAQRLGCWIGCIASGYAYNYEMVANAIQAVSGGSNSSGLGLSVFFGCATVAFAWGLKKSRRS